jgi:thiol:disulfide interchange protein DsbD
MIGSLRTCSVGKPKTAWKLRVSSLFFAFFLILPLASAQRPHPAHWTLAGPAQAAPGSTFVATLDLKLDEPWHMYSLTTPKGGPIVTTIVLADSPAVASFSVFTPPASRKFDPNFNIDTETYDKEARFYLRIALKPGAPAGPLDLTAQMRYQLCTDKECLPPKKVTAVATTTIDPSAPAATQDIPGGWTEFKPGSSAPSPAKPTSPQTAQPLSSFLLVAFGFGLASIFTPCVFPMIPITMSFFLGRDNSSRGQSIFQALVFCLGIVFFFTALGFGLTLALGPFGVTQIGSNPWVNGFIALVFFAFGLSLLGAFEITLPSGLLTKMNEASGRGGLIGTLIMGLTFSLTSFACVGPFMGTLLAASVQGDRLQPALGMMAFSSGLSLPFFFLALFPSYLKKLPRSGGWMARIKVVMGFVILAAMLKYLSNVDQVLQANLLTRPIYLGFWIVLFALPGLYLLGFLRLEGIKPDEHLGVGRLLTAVLFLAFSVSLVPGLFGAKLGPVEAFVPFAEDGAFAASTGAPAGKSIIKNDYDGALAQARSEGKLVLLSFTGYACTNCHWMKANMFPRPPIADALKDFVILELYTDGADAASEENQKRQEQLFQSVAIPFYAILDGDGKVVASFAGLTKDTQQFLAFLKTR